MEGMLEGFRARLPGIPPLRGSTYSVIKDRIAGFRSVLSGSEVRNDEDFGKNSRSAGLRADGRYGFFRRCRAVDRRQSFSCIEKRRAPRTTSRCTLAAALDAHAQPDVRRRRLL